ncbi:hypothetical protein D3C73_1244670 [compost metagenome]
MLLARWNAGAIIPYIQKQMLTFYLRINADLRLWTCVLNGVFQQVNQHPFKQWTVNVNQRQRRRKRQINRRG